VHNAQKKEGCPFQQQQPHGQLGLTNGMQVKPYCRATHTCPHSMYQCPRTELSTLTTLYITGDQNSMTHIPLQFFGSKQKWHFKTDTDLLTFFNLTFPLPNQNS
jgi:hypothetical protein